jgi:hypothetical protein
MNTALHYHLNGMGLGAACGQTANLVHAAVGTGLTTASGIFSGMAQQQQKQGQAATGDIIASAVLSVAAVIQNFFGHPDCSKIATTQIVQQAETMLQQNLSAWLSLPPAQRTPATQQQALANFDYVWNQVMQACSNPQYGSAGKACISDRQQGGCNYKTSPGPGCQPTQSNCWTQNAAGSWTLSTGGAAGSRSACWNWFVGYRDPIANDPNVTAAASSVLPAGILPAGIDPTMLMIVGGIALVVVMLLREG